MNRLLNALSIKQMTQILSPWAKSKHTSHLLFRETQSDSLRLNYKHFSDASSDESKE